MTKKIVTIVSLLVLAIVPVLLLADAQYQIVPGGTVNGLSVIGGASGNPLVLGCGTSAADATCGVTVVPNGAGTLKLGTAATNLTVIGPGSGGKVTVNAVATAYTDFNYVTDAGANNALTATLADQGGTAIPLAAGLKACLQLAHTLQAGANTLAINGGAVKNIKSHFNIANNIATAYAATGIWCGMYDGTQWQDLSE